MVDLRIRPQSAAQGDEKVSTADPPVIAIINTSEELTELFQHLLARDGYRIVVAYAHDLKRGEPSPEAFLREHDPAVVIWDIAIPYEENWAFFQDVTGAEVSQGRHFILTTTNKPVLERLVGPTGAMEIVGKPFDLADLRQAIHHAVAQD
jgi:DNA-binding NarL/FixJ family response regulator